MVIPCLKKLEFTSEPEIVSNINQRKAVETIATYLRQKLASSSISRFFLAYLTKQI